MAAFASLVVRPWRAWGATPAARGLQADSAGVVRWMWSGAVTARSATVVAKVAGGSAPVQLQIQPTGGGVGARIEPASLDRATGVVRFEIAPLRPATTYRYVVLQGGVPWGTVGRFRTTAEGPHDAVILFASCASTGSNASIWDTMRAIQPDVFIHMGDMHYGDITRNDPARFRAAFDRCLMSPRQSAFYRDVPIAYVWDDHDYGGDETDRHSPSAPAAHRVFREYVPHHPLTGGPTGTIQQAFDVGRVRVILTDSRSGRETPPARGAAAVTMLGQAQREWLFAELEAASRRAALVVWANPVPWITKDDEGTREGWAPYHAERAMIADHILRLGLTSRFLMVSGDAHMVAIDDGTNSQYAPGAAGLPGFVVVHAASLDRIRRHKGGPYSHGSRAGRGQFGELRIEDTGERLVATVTCRDRRGRQVRGLSLRLTVAEGASTESVEPVHAAGVA